MPRQPPVLEVRLNDEPAERLRRADAQVLRALQGSPLAHARVLTGIELASSTTTPIAHGLGRRYTAVFVSPPRGPSSTGRIEEIRSDAHDPRQVVALRATGFGATVTVDLVIL